MDDRHYYVLTAQHILKGNGVLQNRAYAYQPPLFPILEAGIFYVAGINNLKAIEVTLAVFGALHCLFFSLWVATLTSHRVGFIAGLWTACYPQFIRYPQTRYSEAFFIFLLSLSMWLIVRGLRQKSLISIFLAGIVCGLGALTREVALFLIPVVICWIWFARPQLPVRPYSLIFTFVLGAILTIAPWTIRNWYLLETFVPISTNGGINFYIGNSPRAEGRYNREVPFDWFIVSSVDWQDGANEVQANKRGFQEGLLYVKSYPLRALKRWALNAFYLWKPPSVFKANSTMEAMLRLGWLIFYVGMFVLGLYGIYKLGANIRLVSFGIFAFVFMSLPYVITYADTRYRLPVESLLIFYSAIGLDSFYKQYFTLDNTPPVNATIFVADS